MALNRVYTIAGAKGGVGKTTSTINLAASLAEDGYSVIAIEMDLPMPNFLDFLDIDIEPEEDPTLADVLAGDTPIHEATYESSDGLSVVPSVSNMDEYEDYELDSFSELIDELRWYYDVILIDTPAGYSSETVRALEVGDEVVIISTPRVASIQNAQQTNELANKYNASVEGFILNKSGTGASPGVESIAESLSVEVLGHVPEDDAVPYSQDLGQPVVMKAPNTGAAIAYHRLADRLVRGDGSRGPGDDSPTDIDTVESHQLSPESEEPTDRVTESLSEDAASNDVSDERPGHDPPTDTSQDTPESIDDTTRDSSKTSNSANGPSLFGKIKTIFR